MLDPIRLFTDWLLYGTLSLEKETRLAESLDFFVYDSIKILLLLFFMVFIMGTIRTFISQKRIKQALSGKIPVIPNILSSMFGALTPFCTCSSIPIFISFMKAGVPLGIAFSFLITSPLVNEYLVVLMFGYFGWQITLTYIISGIILGTIGGMVMGKLGMEKYLVADITNNKGGKERKFRSLKERLVFAFHESQDIVSKTWIWIIFGVGIGAVIHGLVPDELIRSAVAASGALAVPIVVLIGIPIYANCTGVLPIAVALFVKGVPLGTALAFMMAASGLSLPEAIILRRAMKLPLLAVFFAIVALGIIVIGYLFNYFF